MTLQLSALRKRVQRLESMKARQQGKGIAQMLREAKERLRAMSTEERIAHDAALVRAALAAAETPAGEGATVAQHLHVRRGLRLLGR